MMLIKPARPGTKVRDPERGGHLPPEGAEVPDTTYWRRRLADGDVAIVEAPARRRNSAKE